MLTASFNGQTIMAGDAQVLGLVAGLRGQGAALGSMPQLQAHMPQLQGALGGTAQVQQLQLALREYGQTAGMPMATMIQPTGQMDMITLQALAQVAPQLRARVKGQVPDRIFALLTKLGTSPREVATGLVDAQIAMYSGVLAEAVRALTFARFTGGALAPAVPVPGGFGPLAGTGTEFYKKPLFWVGVAALVGVAAYFFVKNR